MRLGVHPAAITSEKKIFCFLCTRGVHFCHIFCCTRGGGFRHIFLNKDFDPTEPGIPAAVLHSRERKCASKSLTIPLVVEQTFHRRCNRFPRKGRKTVRACAKFEKGGNTEATAPIYTELTSEYILRYMVMTDETKCVHMYGGVCTMLWVFTRKIIFVQVMVTKMG